MTAAQMTQQDQTKGNGSSSSQPGERERAEIADAQVRVKNRRPRLKTRIETDKDGAVVNIGPHHADRDGWLARIDNLFGSNGRQFPLAQLNHVLKLARGDNGKYDEAKVNGILAAIDGVAPANEVEAMLALQIAITHEVAMQALLRAQRVDQIPQYESAGGMAVRLLRTFTAQVETLARLRRGGEQVVKVVHVHPGGQAVIGNIQAGRGGEGEKIGDQPHAPQLGAAGQPRSLPFDPGTPLPCPNPAREPVPVPLREAQESMPDARRRAGQRRANR
jgi:hypothetical protein